MVTRVKNPSASPYQSQGSTYENADTDFDRRSQVEYVTEEPPSNGYADCHGCQSCVQLREALREASEQWKEEKKGMQENEDSLIQAIQAMREALEAETRAHNLDIGTLKDTSTRLAQLEALVSMPNMPHTEPSRPRMTPAPGHTSFFDVSHHSSQEPDVMTVAERKSALKQSSQGLMPVVYGDGLGAVVGLQRYDPMTDSYRLTTQSRSVSPNHAVAREALRSSRVHTAPQDQDSSECVSQLRKHNAALMSQVTDLRTTNQETWETYKGLAGCIAEVDSLPRYEAGNGRKSAEMA